MNKRLVLIAIALSALLVGRGCRTHYYHCPDCNAAYRQRWFERGLPFRWRYECECGGKLVERTKDDSGWQDGVAATLRGR